MKVQEWKALLYNYRIIDSLFPLPLPIARLSCIGALSLAGKGHLSFLSVGCTGIFHDHAIVGFLLLKVPIFQVLWTFHSAKKNIFQYVAATFYSLVAGLHFGILFQIVHSFAPPTVPAHLYSPPFVLPVPSCGFGYD